MRTKAYTASIFALSLALSASLSSGHSQNDACRTPCCNNCCENQGYKPAFYCLEGDCGFVVDFEFLYWYARETNLPYAAEVLSKIVGSNTTANNNQVSFAQCLFELDAAWDPGVRVGIGFQDKCDGWDGLLTWTYLKNCEHAKTETPPFTGLTPDIPGQSALLNPFPQRSVAETPFFENMHAGWTLNFNQIDLEFGRKYLVSSCFVMRPYVGLRGAWTKTDFKVSGIAGSKNLSENELDFTQQSRDRFINRIWGVGLLGGFQPTWYFCSCVALYGNFSGALIWGEHREKKEEDYYQARFNTLNSSEEILVNTFNRFGEQGYQMSALLDLAIGLRWERTWCCNRYLTALDLGWEHHVWFSHSKRLRTYDRSLFDGQFNQFDLQVSDLGYGGLVLRLRLEF